MTIPVPTAGGAWSAARRPWHGFDLTRTARDLLADLLTRFLSPSTLS
ncbi:hypothetical protein ABZS88_31745 [Streptomyces sp. NPDC005480]